MVRVRLHDHGIVRDLLETALRLEREGDCGFSAEGETAEDEGAVRTSNRACMKRGQPLGLQHERLDDAGKYIRSANTIDAALGDESHLVRVKGKSERAQSPPLDPAIPGARDPGGEHLSRTVAPLVDDTCRFSTRWLRAILEHERQHGVYFSTTGLPGSN
jgi:hypothetical protein